MEDHWALWSLRRTCVAQTLVRVTPEMSPKTSMQHRPASVLLLLPSSGWGPASAGLLGFQTFRTCAPQNWSLPRPLEPLKPAWLRPGRPSSWSCLSAWCLDRPVLLPTITLGLPYALILHSLIIQTSVSWVLLLIQPESAFGGVRLHSFCGLQAGDSFSHRSGSQARAPAGTRSLLPGEAQMMQGDLGVTCGWRHFCSLRGLGWTWLCPSLPPLMAGLTFQRAAGSSPRHVLCPLTSDRLLPPPEGSSPLTDTARHFPAPSTPASRAASAELRAPRWALGLGPNGMHRFQNN